MQKVDKVKLKNGMEVVFLFDSRFTTSTVQMNFRIGWRHDKKEYLGMAHLFEHLVGKRTSKHLGKSEFTQTLEKNGIESNAYTSTDNTSYFHNQTCENLFESTKMLCEAIYNTNFREDDLEMEKKIVMNERRDRLDSDDYLLWQELMKNLFAETSLTQDLFGTEETMKNITLNEFEHFYVNYKNVKNSFLVIATNSNKQKKKIINFLNDFYSKLPKVSGGEVFKKIQEKEGQIIPSSKINKPERQQANVRVAYKINKLTTKERMTFHVMSQILTGGFAGKLYIRLRDELGLTYGISLWRDSMIGFDYITFEFMCEKQKKDELIRELKQSLTKLETELTQTDIEDVKEMLLFRENRNQSPRSETSSMADAIILGQDYLDSKTYIKLLKEMKVVDMKKMINKIFIKDIKENESICILE